MGLNFGEFDEEQNYGRKLDFSGLASLPEETEYDQFRADYLKRKERGMGEAIWGYASALPEGIATMIEEDIGNAMNNDSMIASMLGFKGKEDFKGSWKALASAPELGLRDTWNMIKSVQSSIRDYFDPEVKGEEEIQRAFARHKFELNYYNAAREHYLQQAAGKFKDDTSLLADFADPTNLVPSLYGDRFIKQGIRKSIKGAAKGVSVTAKGAEKLAGGVEATLGFPAKVLEKKIPKGGNIYRGLQAGSVMAVGSDPFGGIATTMVTVGVAEGLSKVAKAVSREVSEVASVLSSPSSHARFLFKLSTNENVSKQTRALAARAYKLRGTRMYDVVFDALVSGVSSAAMQTAIEFAKGKSAEDMGRAAGGGFVLGAPVGALAGSRGSGKTDEARSDQGIENYLSNKGQMLNKDTIAALEKVDKKTLVALSTLDEFSGLGNMRLQLLDQDSFAKIVGVDPKDAPSAYYDKPSQNIVINEAKVAEGTDAASKIVLHEHGHDIMRQMMGSNPLMRRKILENFYDPNGKEFFFRDSEGSISGSIKVNEQAQQFAKDYADKIRKTDEDYANSVEGTNAYLLAEEIAAEQFSGLMRESPNVFAKYNKSFRHSLMNTARLALSKMGIVEPDSGNLIDSPISESMLKNDGVANVFNNYMQTRNDHYRQRADDIETGRKHEPRAGQSSDNRFTELFGGKGVSTAIGNHYMIKDQTMFDELVQQTSLDAQSLDKDLTGIGKGAEGKRLSEGVRSVFRTAGNSAQAAMDFIDFLQVSIDRRQQIKFGYRSAKWNGRTEYNPFYERSFTPIGWQISPKKPSIRRGRRVFPNLKVVGYDADIISSNVELLQQAGFITNQAKFFEDFAAHADSVLQESGEGRINPLGMGENELFTAALGMKESGQKLQDPKLNEFFSNPDNKLKNAYKSYDLGGMAGAANMNKGGFAFDYNNAKHNYMPMLSGAGADGTTIPQTMYMPSMSTKDNFDSRGLRNNLLEDVLPNITQDKFTPEQLMSEVNKSKGAKEFLEDIGIDQKTLNEIKRGKIIDKSTLEFLIGANQKILNLSVDNSKDGDPIYGDSVERGYRENYEEILYILPESEKYIGGDQSGGHWENDRVLFHVRKTDRILPNGETAYHIEEIQSDWHQYAKGVGYDDSPDAVAKFARKKELQKIFDEGERKYEQRKGNAVRERFFVDEDLFRGIYKNKLLTLADYETDPTQIENDVDTALTMMTKDHEINGYSQVYHNIIGIVQETKKFFADRIITKQKKDMAEKLQAKGVYPNEGEVDFFDLNYESQLNDTQFAHWERSWSGDRNSYTENYFKHRQNLMAEDPYKYGSIDQEKVWYDILATLQTGLEVELKKVDDEKNADANLQDARIEIREMNRERGSIQSAAPMKKSWHSRGLAEAINNAWNEGKRYVSWVTGERSAQQNRLDEHFNFVNVTKLDGKVEKDKLGFAVPDSGTQYKIHAESKTGRSVRKSIKDADELARTIGKDAADHAVKELRGAEAGAQIAVHDVEKPHAGRRIFYDKMVVDAAKRFAKIMGTRPPIKTEISLQDRDSTAAVGTQDQFGEVNKQTQQVWLMELPETKPELPMYMPDIKTGKEDVQTASLIQEYGSGRKLYMPRQPKGRNKKVLLRTTDEIAESIKAEAEERGISANDVYNERLAKQLPPEEKNSQPKKPQNESDITLNADEIRLLKKTTITAEDAAAYKKAVEKRKKLAENLILGDKLFMPSVNERKALKYGQKLSQAQRLDKSIILGARKEWKQLGYEAPNFQRFMKLEDEFGADPPALATLEPNGNFKPIELYYVGDIGVAKNANYDATLNIQKRLFDKVDNRESHRWNADETITVTADRKKARELQAKLDPNHVPLVLASNAKYIFDASNPEHIASLKLPEGEFFPANPEAFFAFEPEIKARGWHGYRVGDEISIFDSTRLKLIKDQSAETKLISKDRPFGKVSGLFGQKLPSDSFNSSTKKDIRFMPDIKEIDARSEWLSKTVESQNFQDFITRKGKPDFALKNERGSYLPVPWYHGGTIGEGNRGKLKDWTFKDNYIWLSSERDFSLEFSMYRGADPLLYEAQMRSASDAGNPIMVATNASNVFHYANPKHIKKLRENSDLDYYGIEDLKLGEWYDVEPHLKLLQYLGFDGARMKQDGTENVVIFNRKDIKLIQDVNDKNRSVEVSGKFIGDQLFLPQLKFDFDGKDSAVEMSPVSKDRAPTFWKLFKINPKGIKVYDKVADVLIDTGTPSNDPANAVDHSAKLGLDPRKLREAMARAQVRYNAKNNRFYMPIPVPTEPQPVLKTKKAFKLFKVGKDKKLYPLFVNANQPVRLNKWQVAEMGEQNLKTGKVKSKIGDLAYRAGWHASDFPMALHIGSKSKNTLVKPDTRRPDEVWAEVELADDFDWTEVAKERAEYNKDGTIKARTAQIIDQVPYNGHYRYKTNPNMVGEWLISGQMKVNRVLSPQEVKDINDRYNVSDLKRRQPQVKLTEKDLNYMPSVSGVQESVHGYIPRVQVEITDNHVDKHYIPDFLLGRKVFPVLGDRLKVGWHTARSGNRFECRGGHDHPKFGGHKGLVAWACGQSGDKIDSVVAGLLKGIERSDGYAATVLMSEEALASNRTYARIMMDELEYDSFHVQGGKAIVEKYIQQAAESLDLPIRNLDDLKAVTPTMVFELRKKLLSRVMPAAYKREIKKNAPKGYKAIDWKDLYQSLASYRDADGYRHGDIIHILKFDIANPMIDLKDIGATPDPTYDVSFRGTAVHSMEGHVSAFDLFKEGLDVFAYDEDFNAMEGKKTNPQRTIQPDRSLGSSSYRVMQMRTAHDLMQRPLTKENTLPSKPIKYKPKVKADEKSLYFRDQRNTKLRKEKESLL